MCEYFFAFQEFVTLFFIIIIATCVLEEGILKCKI